MSTHIFGIRHHGPGCARSLCVALEALQPDIVLVEGPPDAQEVLPLLAHQHMRPPVALLIYRPDAPRQAVYYPFTSFSPEWRALHYALQHDIPARFMDLPQAMRLALAPSDNTTDDPKEEAPDGSQPAPGEERAPELLHDDPLALLAEAAGYSDHELWWEQQIEQRQNVADLFAGILEAMSALRTNRQPKNEIEALREAYMRGRIRAAQKEGFQRIAIVCGAWHAPVLDQPERAQADEQFLKKRKSVNVEATWIPWTNSRLSYRSGYGAGVASPGWYEHLWTAPDRISTRWIAQAAHCLRAEGMDASSASAIEAVRLAETLAALRDLSMPGLCELQESIQTVLCHGNAEPMSLIRERLEIGEKLGQVPPDAPTVPLQRDLEAQQRRLRLLPSTEDKTLDLDLRKDTDRGRSQLLHRVKLLGIAWGKEQSVHGKAGTFHEYWQLQWQVDFAVLLIEANVWGNTIETAASACVCQQAEVTEALPALTELLDHALLAALPEAIERLLRAIQERAAVASDIRHLMHALPPLAQIARYGDVRGTQSALVLPMINGLLERIFVNLPTACISLDDDAAQTLVKGIDQVEYSVHLLDQAAHLTQWQALLQRLVSNEHVHGFVRGRCCRLLLEQHMLTEDDMQRHTALALSAVNPPAQVAAWIEGLLYGGGVGILHLNGLWRALDGWLSALQGDVFEAQLPILRRAFSQFQSPERRRMAAKVKHLYAPEVVAESPDASKEETAFNRQRAESTLAVLAHILLQHPETDRMNGETPVQPPTPRNMYQGSTGTPARSSGNAPGGNRL